LHTAFVPPAGANRGRVHDPLLDGALDAADRDADPAARRALYATVEARQREQMHWLPLWYEDQVAVTSARARAFVPSAEGRWLGLAQIGR
jgi:peptide/nickel transport system substrate-binding protein